MTEKRKVLIIDDSILSIKMMTDILNPYYEVSCSQHGVAGIEAAKRQHPDLILLDVVMDDIDGFEVCRKLKEEPMTSDIPIVFLTSSSESIDEAKGFEAGGADYILKPFKPIVTLARIKTHIKLAQSIEELKRLYSLALDANPITRLPGNNSIQQHITRLIEERKSNCVCYADLDNFKSYNDKYGFANGDRVIHYTSKQMQDVAKGMGIADMFIGHIGGDDFVFTLDRSLAEEYTKMLIYAFDAGIKEFYDDHDRQCGYIMAKDRKGSMGRYPIVSISIACVDLTQGRFGSYFEINDACCELKCKAKSIPGSTYLISKS